MKNRTIAILLGAVLLLGLAALLADRSERARRTPTASGPVLAGFEAGKARKLEISVKGAATVLEKKDGAWTVVPDGFRADETAVSEALDKLGRMEKAELAAENPEKHSALEVKEGETSGVEVKVWTSAEEKPSAHLFIGKTGGDFQSNFVRLAGEPRVYRVRDMVRAAFDRPKGWRDRTILKFAPEDAVRLDLRSEAGTWAFTRPSDPAGGEWSWAEPEAKPAAAGAVDAVVRALASLQADEFPATSDPIACGVAEPKGVSRVTLKDGRTFEVGWGNDSADGRVFVKRPDAATVWEVMTYKRNQVFPKVETLTPAAPADAGPAEGADPPAAPATQPGTR